MLRIGGTASPGHITVFRGLKTHFQQQGIALDWVLYADYDALVEAFATREIDLAWNGPLSYVHIKQRLNDPCRVVAMRDVDVNFSTQLGGVSNVDIDGNNPLQIKAIGVTIS